MEKFGDRFRNARKRLKVSQEKLANDCDVSQGLISKIERGDQDASGLVTKFANYLGVDAHWLATGEGQANSRQDKNVTNVSPAVQQPAMIPLISWVQAGSFNEAIDLHQAGFAEEYVQRITGGKNTYALRVRGDSMTGPVGSKHSFPDGYIIHVDPDQDAGHGDFVIAKVVGEDAVTFKQLKFGDKPYLQPLNPDHKPIFDEFRVLGKVVVSSVLL